MNNNTLKILAEAISEIGSWQWRDTADVFFASPFWRKLQNNFGGSCTSILEEIATASLRTEKVWLGPRGGILCSQVKYNG